MSNGVRTSEIDDDIGLTAALGNLASGALVRIDRPGNFHLHIDHPVPFLCIYRRPQRGGGHVGLNRLTACQTSSLIAQGPYQRVWTDIITTVAEEMLQRFGSFLIVEFWELDESHAEPAPGTSLAAPYFEITARSDRAPKAAAAVLADQLRNLTVQGFPARGVSTRHDDAPKDSFASLAGEEDPHVHWIGLGIAPIYRQIESGHLLPRVLADLEGLLRDALLNTVHLFCKSHTSLAPVHPFQLGPSHLAETFHVADRHLERVADSFSFLLMVTPENTAEAWQQFRKSKFSTPPDFVYRPLDLDPEILKRTLYDVAIEKIEDPTLSRLLREKQLELDRQITMLHERNTPNFLYGSLQVYGGVDPALASGARDILTRLPKAIPDHPVEKVGAPRLLRMAEAEIATYRRQDTTFAGEVIIRDDIPPGMLVSRDKLFIGKDSQVPEKRAVALLNHEIGTHLLTYFNGRHQKIRQLRTGLAGYEGFQEGLAVMAEYLVGGLTRGRLRQLAARVLACQDMLDGANFVETFHRLTGRHGFTRKAAFQITNRIYRSGGLTKDAIYLSGFIEVCSYLAGGGELWPLFVGKIARRHVPDIEELAHRSIIKGPALLPSYLTDPASAAGLADLRAGLDIPDLCKSL